jgi:hypothetical protein
MTPGTGLDVVPGNLGVQLERGVERRADKEALVGHAGDVGLHIAAGVTGVATVELRAESGHCLGLQGLVIVRV